MPDIFGVRTGFNVDASHILPQCVLAIVALIGVLPGVGGPEARTGCQVALSLSSVAVITLFSVGSAHKASSAFLLSQHQRSTGDQD